MFISISLLVTLGLVIWTGPACDNARAYIRARRTFPYARARYLLPTTQKCALCGRAHTDAY